MRLIVVVGLVLLAVFAAAALAGRQAAVTESARCPSGSVAATIAERKVCLRRGQRCSKRLDAQYHRYRFHCHSGRLTGGPKTEKPLPSAGKVVATIPVPASGGIAIGAGSVWVASTLRHTVTRIDPATNRVVAAIDIGSADDPFHGPSSMAYGHGTLWVLDGTADCSCVHRVDPGANRVVATIPLGTPVLFRVAPLGIVVQPDGIWVAVRLGTEESLDGSVIRIDAGTNSVVSVIGVGSDPAFGGPTGITAGAGAIWVGVPSLKAVVRIEPATDSVSATIRGLSSGEGQLAADESAVWVADGASVHRIDPASNRIEKTIPIPGATGAGARGVAVGFRSIWIQAGPLVRLDPASGRILGTVPLDPSLVWGDYSVAVGFDSLWVRQVDSVVRIRPSA